MKQAPPDSKTSARSAKCGPSKGKMEDLSNERGLVHATLGQVNECFRDWSKLVDTRDEERRT